MAFSVQMPALGESVTEGTVTRWLKQEGDQVAVDEPLLEVSTDKVDTEIPSPAAGVLSRIVVGEDETVEVGAELAVIDGDGSGGGSGSAGRDQGDEPARQERDQPEPEPEPSRPTEDASDVDAPSTEQDEPAARPQPSGSDDTSGGSGSDGSDGSGSGQGTPVTMPALGESVTEGTVTRWLKQVGDSVDVDEPLLEVSTDKVDTEIPSPVAGTVLQIDVTEDQTVEVGAQLALIGSAGSGAGGGDAPTQEARQDTPDSGGDVKSGGRRRAPEPQSQPDQQQPAGRPETDGQPGSTPYVTPLVRKLAAEHDVNLSSITGTGVGGRIRKQDVLAAAEAAAAAAAAEAEPEPEPEPAAAPVATGGAPTPAASTGTATTAGGAGHLRGRTEKMSRMRQVIARRMVESLQVSAQLTTVVEVDVTRIARLRDRAKRDFEVREGVKLTFLPFFAKAAVEALKLHPTLNASINSETNEVTYHGAEHLGIAVDTERGLSAPVIHDAGDLNISGLARRIADLADRTRNNKVTPDELGGGTFTLTNTGSRGALFDTPIINQPQVAILGTGAVVKRPVVVSDDNGDTIAIRSMMYLALSYDHRLVDGADAARFLTTVKHRLEEGNFEPDL